MTWASANIQWQLLTQYLRLFLFRLEVLQEVLREAATKILRD